MESGCVCGTNTTVSSTYSELGSHAHWGTVEEVDEADDTFVRVEVYVYSVHTLTGERSRRVTNPL